jgi:hypothetical protein
MVTVVRHCAPEANLTLTAAERRRVESALAHAKEWRHVLGVGPLVGAARMLKHGDERDMDLVWRDTKTLTFLVVWELLIEGLPQSTLTTYVGVSYGLFDPFGSEFSYIMAISVGISFFAGAKAILGLQRFAGELSIGSVHGVALICGRAGQLGSAVFAVALFGCAYGGNWLLLISAAVIMAFNFFCISGNTNHYYALQEKDRRDQF